MRINLGSSPQDLPDCVACNAGLDRLLAKSPALMAAWQALPRRHLKRGDTLIRQGETVTHMWRVDSGLLRLFYLCPDGEERNRSFHADGKWVGAGMPPHPVASQYGIQALEDSELVEMPYASLRALVAKHPELSEVLNQAFAMIFQQQNQRESELLLLDATARYQAFQSQHADLIKRIPLNQIASYLGITNVALSRIRRGLKSR